MTDVFDFHTLVGVSLQGYQQDPEELLARMDSLDVTRAVLCPVRPLEYAYPPSNEYVAVSRDRHPDRFYAFGRIDPRAPDAQLETTRCLTELHLDGVYLNPFEDTTAVTDPRVASIIDICAAHRVPMLIETGYPLVSEALQVADVARRFPTVPIVMTNGAQLNISGLGQRNAWLALQNHANLHITTSGLYRQDFLEAAAQNLTPPRVIFASQSPLLSQEYELHRVRLARVDSGTREQILSRTADRLLHPTSST